MAQPVSFAKTPGPPCIHGGVSKRGSLGMKAMRRRIALQEHFVQNSWETILFRESFRSARASSRGFSRAA